MTRSIRKYQWIFGTLHCVAVILACIPSTSMAEDWYVQDWYGGKDPGSCLIATRDDARGKSIYFGMSDGRTLNNSFSPNATITITDLVPHVINDTYFDITVVFDETTSIDTHVRSSVVSRAADISVTSIYNNRVADYFQSERLNHETLVNLMKLSSSMKILNQNKQVVAEFSLLGFTNIFSRYSSCVRSLEP